jgi:crotonobetainyl-CoA:carnitine CoA-transferase CaiB-like acyl-CoA transferase
LTASDEAGYGAHRAGLPVQERNMSTDGGTSGIGNTSRPRGALEGVRVLDLTRVLAGPFCSMLLGDMGAEIIKVEAPQRGDDSRDYPPFLRGYSAYFGNLNRNKRSVALDLKQPEARSLLLELVKVSDVVLENFKPGTMDKLGLSHEVLREANPRIITAAISVPGTTSSPRPWAG